MVNMAVVKVIEILAESKVSWEDSWPVCYQ